MNKNGNPRITGKNLAPLLTKLLGVTDSRNLKPWRYITIHSWNSYVTLDVRGTVYDQSFIIHRGDALHLALQEALGVQYARTIKLEVDEENVVLATVELEATKRLESLDWKALLEDAETIRYHSRYTMDKRLEMGVE